MIIIFHMLGLDVIKSPFQYPQLNYGTFRSSHPHACFQNSCINLRKKPKINVLFANGNRFGSILDTSSFSFNM